MQNRQDNEAEIRTRRRILRTESTQPGSDLRWRLQACWQAGIPRKAATARCGALIERSDNWQLDAADARCHLMTCCANGEGEAEAGDDDRPLALRACNGMRKGPRGLQEADLLAGGQAEFLGEAAGCLCEPCCGLSCVAETADVADRIRQVGKKLWLPFFCCCFWSCRFCLPRLEGGSEDPVASGNAKCNGAEAEKQG
ncbi:hypothetical protein ACQKWADRAFT_277196 [Trichoderma austrokoningii]